jgi:hypothetical protein
MNTETILLDKDGFQFLKTNDNEYCSKFCLHNSNIILSQIIDFHLIKLIYDLNTDIYEKTNLVINDDNTAVITVLLKHFFKDLGLSQKYSVLQIQRILDQDKIIFMGKTKDNVDVSEIHTIYGIPINAELLSITNIKNICTISTPHKIDCSFYITFDKKLNIPPFVEKVISNIIHKIFIRVKQFIENIVI